MTALMRKLLLAFFLIVAVGILAKIIPPLPWEARAQGPIVGPGQPVICTKIAAIPAGGPTTITQQVAGVAGQSISVCGWHVTNTGATGTFAFSAGTGSNCGTNTVNAFPAQSVTSTAPSADHSSYASITLPSGFALCTTFSVATVAGIIYYVQF